MSYPAMAGEHNGPSEQKRRSRPKREELKEMEMAGGAEGGMAEGSAGGPGQEELSPEPDISKKATPHKP